MNCASRLRSTAGCLSGRCIPVTNSRILLPGVQNADDFDGSGRNAVNHDIVRVNDDFPGSGDPAMAIKIGVLGKRRGRALDFLEQVECCGGVSFCDVA